MIARIKARLAMPSWVVVGPGDDAAVIEPERGALDVVTTDALVDGIHFDRRFVPWDAIGHRALAVNLSDLAAMGATPRAVLLSLALPDDCLVDDMDRLLDGWMALATQHRVTLIGGNITRTPGPMMIDVTAMGTIGRRRVLRRDGARPGDIVYVTGSLGDAAVGLRSLLQRQDQPHVASSVPGCEARYLRPEPRVRAGLALSRTRAASSCMDVSDGLADAVRQVASASAVGITLDGAAIPVSADARSWAEQANLDPLVLACAGGDDYELLFTVRPTHRGRLRAALRLVGDLAVTRIGVVTKGTAVTVSTAAGAQPLPPGFEHFR